MKCKETKGDDYLLSVPLWCQQFDPRFHVPHLQCVIIWSWHDFLPVSSDGTRENLHVLLLTIIFELWWWVRTKVQGNKKRGLPNQCALAVLTTQSQIPCPTPWVCYHMILTQLSSHLEWWHMWQSVNFIVNNNFRVVMMSENENRVQRNKRRGLLNCCALAVSTIQSQILRPTPWVFYHVILTQFSSHLEWWHMCEPVCFTVNIYSAMSKNENEGQRNKKRGLLKWCALAMSAIRSQIPCPTPWVFHHVILTQLSSHLEW